MFPPIATLPLAEGSAVLYARAADIDAAIWEAGFGETHKDYEYYRLLEDTMSDGFTYRFLLLNDSDSNPIALQPLIIADQDLTASTHSALLRVIKCIRKMWPR